jgi:hypothetical protein
MESTKGKMIHDTDMHNARHTASHILYILERFIPDACRAEAHYAIAEACYKDGLELTNKLMRKQYEEWQKITLNSERFSPFSKPES